MSPLQSFFPLCSLDLLCSSLPLIFFFSCSNPSSIFAEQLIRTNVPPQLLLANVRDQGVASTTTGRPCETSLMFQVPIPEVRIFLLLLGVLITFIHNRISVVYRNTYIETWGRVSENRVESNHVACESNESAFWDLQFSPTKWRKALVYVQSCHKE